MFSVPGSFNDWTTKAHEKAEPRREEACVICAVKDWLENRHEVYLFKEATSTTTWSKHFYTTEDNLLGEEEDDDRTPHGSGDSHPASGYLLVEESGAFCLGPKEKIHEILDVERYIKKWPLIPRAELLASSVQHPDDTSMHWLLHTRQVKRHSQACDTSSVAQPAALLPPSAGIGDKEEAVWMCRCCIDHLCVSRPKMPPLALANSFFLGRHHPVFREATLATRMLASSARLLMRQLFLGRGANDEAHKGMTGNTMLVAQPSPSYAQVLPNTATLTDSMVVLFCKSPDDVSKAQVLVVNREDYRTMVYHRQKVCPVFASTVIDNDAIDQLPENAVPDLLVQSATYMPEASNVKTTIHGPASRVSIFCRDTADAEERSSGHSNNSDEEPPAQTAGEASAQDDSIGDAPPPAVTPGDEPLSPPEELNRNRNGNRSFPMGSMDSRDRRTLRGRVD